MPMTMKRIVLSWIRFVSVAAPFAASLTRRTRPVKIDTSFEKAKAGRIRQSLASSPPIEKSQGATCFAEIHAAAVKQTVIAIENAMGR